MTSSMRDLKVYTTYPHSCSYLEDQDFWRLSGIYRDVYLIRKSKTNIQDFEVVTDLDENYEHAHLQVEADTTIKKLVAGEITDVTEAMIAVEKADVSFQTMMTVRNKVMSAYQEIMRMQI